MEAYSLELWVHLMHSCSHFPLTSNRYFGCIFQVREQLPKASNKSQQIRNDIISGSVGGTVGTMLNTPMGK